jgi:Protein of unknown function (DUF2934)
MLESKAKPAAKPKNGEVKTTTKRTATRAAAGKSAAPENVQERIQRRAYELWEIEGRPEGRAQVHWRQAELEITRARSQRIGASR